MFHSISREYNKHDIRTANIRDVVVDHVDNCCCFFFFTLSNHNKTTNN